MRGTYIRDAYIPKLGRVHIFQDTESTTHLYYLAINSDRTGRVRRSDTVFIKEQHADQAATKQRARRSHRIVERGHAVPMPSDPGSELRSGNRLVDVPADDAHSEGTPA